MPCGPSNTSSGANLLCALDIHTAVQTSSKHASNTPINPSFSEKGAIAHVRMAAGSIMGSSVGRNKNLHVGLQNALTISIHGNVSVNYYSAASRSLRTTGANTEE